MEGILQLDGLEVKQCLYCGNYFTLNKFAWATYKLKDDTVDKITLKRMTGQCLYCKQLRHVENKKYQLNIVQGREKRIKINDCKPHVHQGICLGNKQIPYYEKETSFIENHNRLLRLTYDALSSEEKEIYNNIKYECRKPKER
jgi:hypothetical protein